MVSYLMELQKRWLHLRYNSAALPDGNTVIVAEQTQASGMCNLARVLCSSHIVRNPLSTVVILGDGGKDQMCCSKRESRAIRNRYRSSRVLQCAAKEKMMRQDSL